MSDAKQITDYLKRDQALPDPPRASRLTSRVLAEILASRIGRTRLGTILGPHVTLVPAPKSSLRLRDSLWVPQRIANALVAVGLGKEVVELLDRIEPVQKAATSAAAARPKARDHYRTMSVLPLPFDDFDRIVIVDDVVTRGATLLGAASLLAEAYPEAEICGFAMIRTISNPRDFVSVVAPVVGTITRRGEETYRRP